MTIDWSVGRYEFFAEQLLPAAREVLAVADVQPGERVLDVGCGTGNAALLAAGRGAVVTGVDPARRLLQVADDRARTADVELDLRMGEAAALPVPEAAYDVVLSVFAAVFATDAAAALRGMARALAPTGRLVMTAWVPGGPIGEIARIAGAAVAAATGTPPAQRFPWHEEDRLRDLAATFGMSVQVADRTLAFTAASPEAYLAGETEHHPAALSTLAVLDRHGDVAAVRQRMLAALRDGNEDPAAFRATSRYRILTLRPR